MSDISLTCRHASQFKLSGSLEAWKKIPGHLFHVMFCLGTGSIIPSTNQWMEQRFKRNLNPTKIILLASATVLELVWCFQAKSISQASVFEIHKLAASAKEHANRVWQLKELVLNSNKGFCGIKIHALKHMVDQISEEGVPSSLHGHSSYRKKQSPYCSDKLCKVIQKD